MAFVRNLAFLLAGAAGSVATATALPQQPATNAGQPAADTVDALRNRTRNMECPEGLERILPGIYYYCLGAKDLASGRHARGMSLLQEAAAWGSKPAQFTLGLGYFKGDVAPRDRPLGLAWLGLSTERGDPFYAGVFNSAWQKATPDERARADVLWKSLLPEYEDAHAAARAWQLYERVRNRMLQGEVFGASWCIRGVNVANGGMAPARENGSRLLCSGASGSAVAKKLDHYAAPLFDGLRGKVTVGPLQQVSRQEGSARP